MESKRSQDAAPVPPDASVDYRTNGTVRSITANDLSAEMANDPAYASLLQDQAFAKLAAYLLQQYGPLLKLEDPANELILSEEKTDSLGYRQVRFRQVFNEVPIIAYEVVVHFNASDAPYLIQGNYLETPIGFKTSPTLTGEEVLTSVKSMFPDARIGDLGGPAIWANAKGQPRLVFVIPIEQSIREKFTILVNAHDGAVLEKLATTFSQIP